MNPQGGTYWIPANEYAWAVTQARYDPAILNAYPFVPLAADRFRGRR